MSIMPSGVPANPFPRLSDLTLAMVEAVDHGTGIRPGLLGIASAIGAAARVAMAHKALRSAPDTETAFRLTQQMLGDIGRLEKALAAADKLAEFAIDRAGQNRAA